MRLVAFALVLCFALSASAQEFRWAKTLESARAEAKERNVPLLISMHTSGEKACKRMLGKVYRDPQVRARLAEFVVLPTCFDTHGEVEAEVDGKKKPVSKLFGQLGCNALMANERAVRDAFFDTNEVTVPQHIFVDPEGKVLLRKVYELKTPKFLTLLDRAQVAYGASASETLDDASKGYLKDVKEGSQKEREEAVKALLDFEDEKKNEILYLTIKGIRKDKDRAVCVRAMGFEQYAAAAPLVMKWLEDPSPWVRNCAIVTLEEMKASESAERLLELWSETKDKEIKKDLLRALGPCAPGDEAAHKILTKPVKDRDERNRVAAYLSLGHFVDDEKVRTLLRKRFKAEGRDTLMKTAILWGYSKSRDSDLTKEVDALLKGNKNKQLEMVAEAAKVLMRGEDPDNWWNLVKAIGPLYARDKVMRNEVKVWKEWGRR